MIKKEKWLQIKSREESLAISNKIMLPQKRPPQEIKLFGVTISTDEKSSTICRVRDDDGDDKKKKRMADDQKPVKLFGANRDDNSSTGRIRDDDNEEDEEAKNKQQKLTKGKEKIESSHRDGDEMLIDTKKMEKEGENVSFGLVPPVFHTNILGCIQQYPVDKRPVFLFRKRLDILDVDRWLNRLLIGRCRLVTEVFAELERKEANSEYFVKCIARDAWGFVYKLLLQRSVAEADYILGFHWRKFVRRNELWVGDEVEGWGIRFGDEICMALLIFRD